MIRKRITLMEQLSKHLSMDELVRLKRILFHLRPTTAETIVLLLLMEKRYLCNPVIENNQMRFLYCCIKSEVFDYQVND